MHNLNRRALLGSVAATLAMTGFARAETASGSTPPDLSLYAAAPAIEDIALSPDGQRIAILSKDNGKRLLIDYEIATSISRNLALPDAKVRSIQWVGPQHLLVHNTHTAKLGRFRGGRREMSQVHLVDVRTGKGKTLFSQMRGHYNIVMGDINVYLEGGQYFVTASNYHASGHLMLVSFDMNGKARTLDEGRRDGVGWVVTPTGWPIARALYDDGSKLWSLQFRDGTKWKTVFTQKEDTDYPSLVGLGRSDNTVIIYIEAGENAGQYFEVNAEGVLSEPLNTKEDQNTALFHPVTKRFAGFTRTGDWVTEDYADPGLSRLTALAAKALPNHRTRIYEFADDPRKMLVYGESPQDSGSYYFFDFSTGANEMVGENYRQIPSEWIMPKTPITYKAADGLDIPAFLTLPPAPALKGREAKNLPLIVLPHGGPQSRDYLNFDWEVQTYASRGYAVLQPNFRGSSGYGADFVEKGYGEWGRKMQTDLSDGVRHLVKQGIADPARVAIIGASYGGYAALAGAAIDSGVYRCAVSVAGISDLNDMLIYAEQQTGTRSPTVLYWRRFMGDLKRLDEVSPVKQAERVNIPVLLIHGEDDTVVPIDQSRRMERALQKAGKNVQFVRLDGEDHWQSSDARRLEMARTILTFLEKHNPA